MQACELRLLGREAPGDSIEMDPPPSHTEQPVEKQDVAFPVQMQTAFSSATLAQSPCLVHAPYAPLQTGLPPDESRPSSSSSNPPRDQGLTDSSGPHAVVSDSSNVAMSAYSHLRCQPDWRPAAADSASCTVPPPTPVPSEPASVKLGRVDADENLIDNFEAISPNDFGLLRMIGGRSMLGILVQQVLQRVKGTPQLNTYLLEAVDAAVLVRKLTDLVISALQPCSPDQPTDATQEVRPEPPATTSSHCTSCNAAHMHPWTHGLLPGQYHSSGTLCTPFEAS